MVHVEFEPFLMYLFESYVLASGAFYVQNSCPETSRTEYYPSIGYLVCSPLF
jgi:hypothetical protein